MVDPALLVRFAAATYLVFVALMIGSLINLAADRLPRGESLIRPRSHCRSCGRQLGVLDLIPVAGYVIRGGRCASCRAAIGISSPLVEAAAGASMAVSVIVLGLWPGGVLGLVLVAVLGLCGVAQAFARRGVAADP